MKEGVPNTSLHKSELPPGMALPIYEAEEAQEKVAELVAAGVRPLISVPLQYAEKFSREGLRILPHKDWASGDERSVIAGTIGVDPFLQENEERAIFEVDPAQVQMAARLTGPDKAFHGVIVFTRGIPAEALRPRGSASIANWPQEEFGNEKRPPPEGEAAGRLN